MAKISPVSIKYIIHANFISEGVIEKPDIIGAIFGQTEGLLGDDLEMRDLQKNGKIGRIEVTTKYDEGKTSGEIEVPSAMDKTETALIGAALETIERIGPSDTKIAIDDIEDVRGSKRDYILERAKKLMAGLGKTGNDIDEMTNEIKDSAKIAKMQTYGTENLPCGDISGDEVIIVEGRADVVNLLKNGIKNAIAMNGMKLPPTIVELAKEKPHVTLFVDGDRGGSLIIKNVTEQTKIDFICVAPDGKEVEELTGKELLQTLRKKVKSSEFKANTKSRGVRTYSRDRPPTRDHRYERREEPAIDTNREIQKMTSEEKEKIQSEIDDLVGTKGVILFNKDLEKIKKIPLSRLPATRTDEEAYVIVIDGTANPRIIRICEGLRGHNIIAKNFVDTDTKMNLESF